MSEQVFGLRPPYMGIRGCHIGKEDRGVQLAKAVAPPWLFQYPAPIPLFHLDHHARCPPAMAGS